MIRIKRSENPPLTSSRLFWTAFMAFFVLFIYRITKNLWQIKTIAAVFLAVNVLFFAGWIYLRNFAPKQRLLANRNSERLFGAWLAYVILTQLLLCCMKPQGAIQQLTAVLLSLLLCGLLLFFFAKQETKLLVSTIEITTPKITEERIRIVQISDLHAGLWCGLNCLEETVTEVNAAAPDIIVCTGDLKDEQLGANCGEELTVLSRLRANMGKFAILGNHDYTNAAEAADFTAQSGFELLDGRAVEMSGLVIAGAGDRDHCEKQQWGLSRPELLVLAYEFIQKESFLILLRHRGIIEDGQKTHFDLQLSGYKNGMSPLRLLLRKIGLALGKGKCKKTGGGLLYKADGAGYIGAPVRMFCKPEIVIIDLVKETG